jgi:AraC family transcriptional regulator
MSDSHFTRAFRNVLKITPHRYVMWRRLLRAQDLIKSSDSSIAEIALVGGYNHCSILMPPFRHNAGIAPANAEIASPRDPQITAQIINA